MNPLDTDDPYLQYPPRPPRRSPSPWRPLLLVLIFGLLLGWYSYRFFGTGGRPAVDPRPVTPRGDLAADEKSTIELFRNVGPSVVFITTVAQRVDLRTRNILEIPAGTGSGFIWDEAGHIVTNFHVVRDVSRGAGSAQVTLADHTGYPADLVGVAPSQDLAVLRLRGLRSKLPPINVGTSSDLVVGQKAFAIGNPFGLDQSLTTGVVSALGRTIPALTGEPIDEVIQTDASINPGNSGGPLLDSAGRLIGVNTAIFSPSGSSAGVGFAVPVDTVNRIVPQLIKTGRAARPYLGVSLDDQLSRRVLAMAGVKAEGLLILGVAPDSPAAAAGLRGTERAPDGTIIPGDIIQKIGDDPVKTTDDVYRILSRRAPGESVRLTIRRGDQTLVVEVKLGVATE